MGIYDSVINATIDLCENNLDLYSTIGVGALPANNGIAIQLGVGSPNNVFLDKGTVNEISLVANSKHEKQSEALEVLDKIHRYLTRLKQYPSGDCWQITDISTGTAPNYIGQESDQQYMYGSIIKIKFYCKGV